MAAYSGCGEGDGGIGHGKRRSRTGLARVGGDVQLAGTLGQWRTGAVDVGDGPLLGERREGRPNVFKVTPCNPVFPIWLKQVMR